jgi:uncharacterized protein
VDADAVEIRVLGCLIEKQRTTPDTYPLSLNALRLACNQSTNRDPVVEYDEGTIREALERLGRKRWARLASGATSRAYKYRQLLDETLQLSPPEMAVLAVLMLRGPQTLGELKGRTERLHRFATLEDVEATLEGLSQRRFTTLLPRRPGQKEQRYAQLLGGDAPEAAGRAAPGPPDLAAYAEAEGIELPPLPAADGVLEGRVEALEREVAELRQALAALRDELGA